jgi:hypothetical protein
MQAPLSWAQLVVGNQPRGVHDKGLRHEVPHGTKREGSFDLPSPKRCGMGASLAPVTTTPQMENALVAQAMMTVPLWTVAPRPKTDLPSA